MPRAPASAVYEGIVCHRRFAPHPHQFRYRIAQLLLDLDELDFVFAGRWLWSVGRRNLAEFRRSDYLGPLQVPLKEAVQDRVARATGRRPEGPIRVLTHLRYGGYIFNPVTFYYCYQAREDTELSHIVADITNTPWGERYAYVLTAADAERTGPALRWQFDKCFHVSPFMPMDRVYAWRFSSPAETLGVHMEVLREGNREFDATLALQRRPLGAGALCRVLACYPVMTAQVIGAIYWQALRLRLKRNPFYSHPNRQTST